ncbi:MAG: tetratricopeptide repeat protein [Nannocystales bacterium]
MSDSTGQWLRELAQVEDAQFEDRADAQYAAVMTKLRAQRIRRWTFAGVAGLAAVVAGVFWTPESASRSSRASPATAAVNYAEPSAEERVARTSSAETRSQGTPDPRPLDRPPDPGEALPEGAPSPLVDRAPPKPPRRRGRVVPSWRTQIHDGKVAAALAGMNEAAWSSFLRLATAQELLAVAQAARAAKRTGRARDALTEIRDRFARDKLADQATFLLGRVEAELGSDDDAAARWFARYVREFPRGEFVEQARGRILRDLVQRGETADARQAARDYLRRHPEGGYAPLARRLVVVPQ